jgi:hypothetical protein
MNIFLAQNMEQLANQSPHSPCTIRTCPTALAATRKHCALGSRVAGPPVALPPRARRSVELWRRKRATVP